MEGEEWCMRIGHGYDAHRLTEGRKLVLGGVEIPYEKGLFGHSDADVLLHALADAILGAAALGDIGKLFPDSDPATEGIDSRVILRAAASAAAEAGYALENCGAVYRPDARQHRGGPWPGRQRRQREGHH